ncbi:14507_t:CDS:2 [Ambispora leptoticha]|uniref:14507_t:CDS:1 n=1 Tax=Ambispora leptoticha TaxID=144679 RepID=A0A9N8WA88_9GLOM|nr:14507_t:CDS:2 [Ambispora leptoticha]
MGESLAKSILEVPLDVPLGLILKNNSEKLQEIAINTNTSVNFTRTNYNPRVEILPRRREPATTRRDMEDARIQVECLFANNMRTVPHLKIPINIYRSHATFVEDLLSPTLRKISDKHKVDALPRIYKNEAYVVFLKNRKDPRSVIDKPKREVERFLARFSYPEPRIHIPESIELPIPFDQDILTLNLNEFKDKFQKEIRDIENETNTIIEYDYEKSNILIKAVEFSSNVRAKRFEAYQLMKELISKINKSKSKNQDASYEESEIVQNPKRTDSFDSDVSSGSEVKENSHNLDASFDEIKLEFDFKYSKKVSNNSESDMLYTQSPQSPHDEFLTKWRWFRGEWLHSGYYKQFESLFGSK